MGKIYKVTGLNCEVHKLAGYTERGSSAAWRARDWIDARVTLENPVGRYSRERGSAAHKPHPFRFDDVFTGQTELLKRRRAEEQQLGLKFAAIVIHPESHLVDQRAWLDARKGRNAPLIERGETGKRIGRNKEPRRHATVRKNDRITAQRMKDFKLQELLGLHRLRENKFKKIASKNSVAVKQYRANVKERIRVDQRRV